MEASMTQKVIESVVLIITLIITYTTIRDCIKCFRRELADGEEIDEGRVFEAVFQGAEGEKTAQNT